MSDHEGVSCDSCLRSNFRGKRYKCLICFDYDLCSACHDSGTLAGNHNNNHPMQCIITRNDIELYFAGESLTNDLPHSYTCPFCGKLGFTESTLYEHVIVSHTDISAAVVCPICATLPGGEPNQVSDDFLTHLNVEHHNNHELEEPQVVRIRSRNHVRLHNNRSRRPQFLNPNGSTNSNIRDSIDPFTQLLSRLSGVHRISNNSTNGQAMQMPFERHANRMQIDRILHRQRRQTPLHSLVSAHSESNSNQQMPYMVLLDSTTSPVNASSLSKSNTADLTNNSGVNFLLSTCNSNFIAENERQKLDILKADRSIFIQELIFASLSGSINIQDILSIKSTLNEESKVSKVGSDFNLDKTDLDNPNTKSDNQENSNTENNCTSDGKINIDKVKTLALKNVKTQLSDKYFDLNVITSSTSLGFTENENVQPKSLPSLVANGPNSAFIVPQNALSHRTRTNKGRSTSSITTANLSPNNIASLALRSRPGATINVVSSNGRKKTLKQTTEPPPN